MAKVRKRTWMTKTLGEHTRWIADYFAPGPDGKRKRHTKSFKTKKEATAWLANTVVEIRLGTHTPAHKSPTVLEAGQAWLAQAETDGLERSTTVAYRQLLDLHVRPFPGHLKLAELTPGAVPLQVGVDIPTKAEIQAMIAHAGRLRSLLLTAVFTGLRASELRGLTWSA